jgi:hypothetical protein
MMDPLAQRVAQRFAAENAEAGDGDDAKSLSEAMHFIDQLLTLAQKARHELESKKEPGREMHDLVAKMIHIRGEEWWEHWYH